MAIDGVGCRTSLAVEEERDQADRKQSPQGRRRLCQGNGGCRAWRVMPARCRASLFVNLSGDEMPLLIEMIEDLSVN
jgi:hypothetical protein